jgi:GTP-binding protein HflX
VLHVIDASNPERERHVAAVTRVLEEVGAVEVPRVEVYNKIDLISADERRRIQDADPAAHLISAHKGGGIDELLDSVAARLALDQERVTIDLDLANPVHAERLAWLYRHATVHSHATMGERATIEADVPRRLLPMVGLATPDVRRASRRG